MRGIGAVDLHSDRVACGMKPLAATIGMAPALEMYAFWIAPRKEIAFELFIRRANGMTRDMRLAARGEFGFFGEDADKTTVN